MSDTVHGREVVAATDRSEALASVMPLALSRGGNEQSAPYFRNQSARLLADFFRAKGLAALKQEDRAATLPDPPLGSAGRV